MANPFQSFVSNLASTRYFAPQQSAGMSKATPAQLESFRQPTSTVSGTPTATSPASSPIAPAKAGLNTPAAQQYISGQVGGADVAGNQAAAARMGTTIPGVGGGDTLQNFKTANPGVTPNSQDYAIMGGANAPTQSDPYMTYLSSLFNPEQLKTSKGLIDSYGSKINDATSSLYGIQNEQLARKVSGAHDYQNTLDESGGLLGGAQQSAAMSARRSNAELADLAVQESAKANTLSALTGARKNAQDTYDQMIGAGKSVYEAKQAADKVAADAKQQTTTNQLAQDKFNEDKRQFGLDYALKQQTERRVSANAANPKLSQTETKQNYISQFTQAFAPGKTMADGTPTVDQNGFLNPKAFKEAASEASGYGITRKEFIDLFGSELYTDKTGQPDKAYGLTPTEIKLITGALQ